nr:MAG TPA: hypothetical protein [Caudoviricetes sp.]
MPVSLHVCFRRSLNVVILYINSLSFCAQQRI